MGPGCSRAPAADRDAHGPAGASGVVVADPAWRRLVPRADAVVLRAARAAGTHAIILLADDRTVRRLNARDRGRDKPTNVLTYDPPAPGLPGQIVLAVGVLRREAAAAHRRPAYHLAHLVVHAALHLAGEDHAQAGDARRMEMAEARILGRIGVPNPWKHGQGTSPPGPPPAAQAAARAARIPPPAPSRRKGSEGDAHGVEARRVAPLCVPRPRIPSP